MAVVLGRIGTVIKTKLEMLRPIYLEIINESHKHNVPPGSESHFKVVIVSSEFEGQSLLQRHRAVNTILSDELKEIHALSILAKTPSQWDENSTIATSPACLGGSKFDTKFSKEINRPSSPPSPPSSA